MNNILFSRICWLAFCVVAVLGISNYAYAKTSGLVSLGGGVDTHPSKTVGEAESTDMFWGLAANVSGLWRINDRRLLELYSVFGLRRYWKSNKENGWVQKIGFRHPWKMEKATLGWEGEGQAKLFSSRNDNSFFFDSSLYYERYIAKNHSTRITVGLKSFLFPSEITYSYSGPYIEFLLRYQMSRSHFFTLSCSEGLLWYRGEILREESPYFSKDKRQDWPFEARGVYGYKGRIGLQFGYLIRWVKSNSFGENHWRHNWWVLFSTRLWGPWVAMLQASYQYFQYTDGGYSQGLFLVDDESRSSITAKVSCPIWKKLDMEAKYSLQWSPSMLINGGKERIPEYLRQTAFLGITYRW
jgi:hypothetical protein